MLCLFIGAAVYASYLLLAERKPYKAKIFIDGGLLTSSDAETQTEGKKINPAFSPVKTKWKGSRCPLLSIDSEKSNSQNEKLAPILCNVPEQVEEFCVYTESFFRTEIDDRSCRETVIDLCEVETDHNYNLNHRHSHSDHVVSCHNNHNVCNGSETFSLGMISPSTGFLHWKHFAFLKGVEDELNHLLKGKTDSAFCFIRCGTFWDASAKTQLLIFPPNILKFKPKQLLKQSLKKKPFNVNLILLDSVSRPHLYRSLPHTVELFRKINLNASIPTTVLDFELVHAVKARTFETLHALFSGKLLQLKESGDRVNPVPVEANVMFEIFSKLGYQTLWQEDMCWKHEWGLVRNLKVLEPAILGEKRWKKLNSSLEKNFIDHVGITHSSCEVFRKYQILEPFHYPPVLCYSGKQYHEYFLEYLISFLENIRLQPAAKPLFSFSILCTGHEGSGKRIKTLDFSLQHFVQKLIDDDNTFTIIFSDHGNTYGQFAASVEGQFEAFHPHMFMIIPDRLVHSLGKEKIAALKTNQKRLVTVQDLHFMLAALSSLSSTSINEYTNIGLFKELSPNRTCADLNLLSPSLCICDGMPSKVPIGHFYSLVAEYALGQLNELILKQYTNSLSTAVLTNKHCLRLKGNSFDNVKQTRITEKLKISLNLHVQVGEIFKVEVRLNLGQSSNMEMELLSYERLTEYGVYRSCRDPNIESRLCICNHTSEYFLPKQNKYLDMRVQKSPLWQFDLEEFGVATKAENKHENCLFILSRVYSAGIVLEAANSCLGVKYDIKVVLNYSNMQSSAPNPVRTSLQSGAVRFLVVLVSHNPNDQWKWDYTLHYKWETFPQ